MAKTNEELTNEQLLDEFAGMALSALINKLPFYDIDGEFGIKVTPEELQEIKKGVAKTAYEYASWMIIARPESKKWLKENEDKF